LTWCTPSESELGRGIGYEGVVPFADGIVP